MEHGRHFWTVFKFFSKRTHIYAIETSMETLNGVISKVVFWTLDRMPRNRASLHLIDIIICLPVLESVSKVFSDGISRLFIPYMSYGSETLHRGLSQFVSTGKNIFFT